MKYIISTLGCKVNQYETQAIETMLAERGHSAAAEGEHADAIIINTCAVTAESGRKSRQTVRHLSARHPEAATVVCGCWSQLSPDDAADIGCDVVFGTGDKHALIDAIEAAVLEKQSARCIDDPFRRMYFEELPAGAVSGRTRAMLKIEDGWISCSGTKWAEITDDPAALPGPHRVKAITRVKTDFSEFYEVEALD